MTKKLISWDDVDSSLPDVVETKLNSTYARVTTLPINLASPVYGGKCDGVNDDSAAWVAAIATMNATGCGLAVPRGTSVVARATPLPALTALGSGIFGDPSGGTTVKFTAAGGGFVAGNGTDYVYLTQLRDLVIDGSEVATTLMRMHKPEEPDFQNVKFIGYSNTALWLTSPAIFTSRRIALGGGPIGVKIDGTAGSLIFDIPNFYNTTEPIKIVGSSLSEIHVHDGWIEACPDVVTFANPSGLSVGKVELRNNRHSSTLANMRLIRATATNVDAQQLSIKESYFQAAAMTSPLIDFTAVDNSAVIAKCLLRDLNMDTATALGAQVLVKPHAAQAWWNFYIDCQRISGVPPNQWSTPPAVAGGGRVAPSILHGTGSPETILAAFVGSTYQRYDGGTATSFYVKQSGTGNTGWAAK